MSSLQAFQKNYQIENKKRFFFFRYPPARFEASKNLGDNSIFLLSFSLAADD